VGTWKRGSVGDVMYRGEITRCNTYVNLRTPIYTNRIE
jgi:hypothetical protein